MEAGRISRFTAVPIEPPPNDVVERVVASALEEDRVDHDVTTLSTVSGGLSGVGRLLAKEPGTLAGLLVAATVFRCIDATVVFTSISHDGDHIRTGDTLAEVRGPVRAILQGERVALNLVQRLSGTATLTSAFVDAVSHTSCSILDTRKTTPGLRDLEKYAVRCGGGTNHRRDLSTMAMIKDNHREALASEERSLAQGVAAIRKNHPGVQVEVEIDSLDDLEAALAGEPEWVLLDNMPADQMRKAVLQTAGRAKLEASGGVTLLTVRAIAETGVDAVSVGALTHSARALDIGLDLEFES